MEQYFAFWSFFFSKQLHGPSFQTRNQMPGEFSVPAPAALIWPLTPLKTLKSPVVQSSWGMLTGSRWQEVLRWSLEVILWQNNLPNARAHHCLKVDPLWNIQLIRTSMRISLAWTLVTLQRLGNPELTQNPLPTLCVLAFDTDWYWLWFFPQLVKVFCWEPAAARARFTGRPGQPKPVSE